MGSLGRKIFSSTTPHFFIIIVEDTSRDHKLNIPKKFMIRYGEDLSNSVCLKLPSGSEWEVELTRCNGVAWFERGWSEFSRFCSLNYGTFLVFRYEGNSRFEVCIFDTSTTEIDYPLIMPKIEEDDEDDLSIEISEDLPPCPKRRENSSLLCPPCKKTRTSLSGKLEMISENGNIQPYDTVVFEKRMVNKDSHRSKTEVKKETYFATQTDGGCSSRPERFLKQTCRKHLGRIKPLTTTEKAIALQRANAFKADKPFFKMAMQPSQIYGSTISLPYEFAEKHLIKLSFCTAILRVSDRRTWSMKFKYDHKNSKARLQSGWLHFVRENNLKVGDVCVFVLIDCKELLFEVFFFPTVEATNCPFSPGHGKGAIVQVKENRSPIVEADSDMNCEIAKNKMPKIYKQVIQKPRSSCLRTSGVGLEAAKKFVSDNPFFLVPLSSINRVKKNVSIPASFFKSFIKRKKQTVKLQVEDRIDRSWHVNLIPTNNSARLCGGWPAFAKELHLQKGDVCIFEVMDMKEIVLKVHIFRCG